MSEQECGFVTKDGRLRVLRGGVVRVRGRSPKTRGEETYETAGNLDQVTQAGKTIRALLDPGSTGPTAQRVLVHLDVLRDYKRDLAAGIGPADMIILVTDLRTTDSVQLVPPFALQEAEQFAEAMIRAAEAAKDTA